jgi:hypothetical protein
MRHVWYWSLFALESAGMAFVFSEGLPFYHRLLRGAAGDRPGAGLHVTAALALVVMQICYWVGRGLRPRAGPRRRPVPAHVLLFLSRLSFIFAGSVLSLVIFVRSSDTRFSFTGLALLLGVAFAQFCYSLELEALSRVFDDRDRPPATLHQGVDCEPADSARL